MSVKAMSRVWDLDLPHAERLVLLALADHADHVGDNIYPSIGLIAWKTGYSERQVQRVIHSLCASGLLVEKRRGGGRGKPTVYQFNLSAGKAKPPYVAEENSDKTSPIDDKGDKTSPYPDKMSPFSEGEKVTSATLKGDIYDIKGDIAMSPEPINRKNPLNDDVRDAAMKLLGLRAEQRRKVLAKQPKLSTDELAAWRTFYESPPAWCTNAEGFIYKSLINGDGIPAERKNGRRGPELPPEPTETWEEMQAFARKVYDAEIASGELTLDDVPEWYRETAH